MAAPMAPITWCDRRTMQPFSRCGRMLVESDPQERALCGIGLGRGRMRAAPGGQLGHRLGGWRGDLAHTICLFRHAGRISVPHGEITYAAVTQRPRIIASVRAK